MKMGEKLYETLLDEMNLNRVQSYQETPINQLPGFSLNPVPNHTLKYLVAVIVSGISPICVSMNMKHFSRCVITISSVEKIVQ